MLISEVFSVSCIVLSLLVCLHSYALFIYSDIKERYKRPFGLCLACLKMYLFMAVSIE